VPDGSEEGVHNLSRTRGEAGEITARGATVDQKRDHTSGRTGGFVGRSDRAPTAVGAAPNPRPLARAVRNQLAVPDHSSDCRAGPSW
jgi:hypothetical protein